MALAVLILAMACGGGGGGGGGTTTTNVAPRITTQPLSKTVNVGETASFTVAASGTPTPTFKWERSNNGGSTWTAISGATKATYSITATIADDTARFRAIATNGVSPAATSNAATLTVNENTVAPEITTQPLSQTVNAGDIVSFTVAASGIPTPTFTWERSNDAGSTWTAIGGATNATYSFTTTLADTTAQFRAIATNGVSPAATSHVATLTVNENTVAPEITTQPLSRTVTAGDTASFTVAASGTPAPTFAWERSNNGGSTWAAINGATNATYSFTTTLSDNNAQFRAIATNGVSPAATSHAATLTVNEIAIAPKITTQPLSQTVNAGDIVGFAVVASGTPAPTFAWERSDNGGSTWTAINGATDVTYSFTTNIADNNAQFRAIATNGVSPAATSDPATLTVTATEITIAVPDVTNPGTSVNLLLEPIPAGTFLMGSQDITPGSYTYSDTAHTVTLARPLYMAKFECTQAQWKAVMNANPSSFSIAAGYATDDFNRPVETVCYDDIMTGTTGFMDRLNAATADQRPQGMVFRLPTEAEWEYACRAGSVTNFYYGHDDVASPATLNQYAWFDSATDSTHPVGAKLPNAWGLYDMAGNVFELCEDDWHDNYDVTGAGISVRPDDGNAWVDSPTRAANRVARGGSTHSAIHWCQSHERGQLAHDTLGLPAGRDSDDGFRLVLAVAP